MKTVPFQHPWSVKCLCGIVGDHVIGPYFFEGRLTGLVYANFLQNILPQLMEDVPLRVRMNVWMQHDGAPPDYALCSRQVMNEIFDEKWIGQGAKSNITRLRFKGFCQRTRNGGSTYRA